jgi:bacteriorhodopsin
MKRLLAVVSVFEAFALATFARNRWFLASPQGGSVTFTVDAFGERWAAYLLWLVLTPVLVLGLHYTLEAIGAPDPSLSSRRRGTPSTGFF